MTHAATRGGRDDRLGRAVALGHVGGRRVVLAGGLGAGRDQGERCQQRGGESVNELSGAALRGQGAVRLCVSRANSDLELDL